MASCLLAAEVGPCEICGYAQTVTHFENGCVHGCEK